MVVSLERFDPAEPIASELGLSTKAVRAVTALLREGSTVPFIARYRKEATGGLDEVAIRRIVERADYLSGLEERRRKVLDEIASQGKLDGALRGRIERAQSKTELEDLYAPFRPKRRTRATVAKEKGLEPLAERMWAQPRDGHPEREARAFVSAERGVADVPAALAGARDICAERIADHADRRRGVREELHKHGVIEVRKVKAKRAERTKFDDYAEHREALKRIASHRYLAICRGESEGVLKAALRIDDNASVLARLERSASVDRRSAFGKELAAAAADGLTRLMLPRAGSELRTSLKECADREAVEVFASNLRDLLLAAPFGSKPVLGIDPGQRTGCKCTAVDATGKMLAYDTVFLVQGAAKLAQARTSLLRLLEEHPSAAVAVGNGTHGRETEAFVRDLLRDSSIEEVTVVSVSESGASIYSASPLAREELPDLDVTYRGAVSIARRLQDPLAELVKLDPKSIGVGQYQHDVQQTWLSAKLDEVVEDCVTAVGVELNTASAPLLARVAGIGPKLAAHIVAHRDAHGRFRSRRQLLKVKGLGNKTYEQAAGFLRIRKGEHVLDASAVHPERYRLVERMARDVGIALAELVASESAIARIDAERYVDGEVGRFTIDDILAELARPGRDPRARFEPPAFRDDVRTLDDLHEGMQLEGVVTNVTNFGAFVDVGVKQDGLVHISQLADHFVQRPSDVVRVGDKLQVRVLGVDLDRKRISLSARRG